MTHQEKRLKGFLEKGRNAQVAVDKILKQPDCVKIFNCKHFQEYSQSVPMPFGPGNCSEPLGDCAIKSESEDCSVDCPDYQQPDCQPSAGDFVKEFKACLAENKEFFLEDEIPEDVYKARISFIIANAEQACDLLEANAKTIAEQAEAIKRLKETSKVKEEIIDGLNERLKDIGGRY